MAWKLAVAQSAAVYVAPGNGGTAMDAVAKRQHHDARQLLAGTQEIALTVVEPRRLAAGIVDTFAPTGCGCLADEGRCSVIELKAFRRPS
jgi:phosphoribosylamine-glycine ligase